MEFFRSTEFYCLAIVVAIALLGLLLQQPPQKPAETYIARLQLALAETLDYEMLCLCVMPDGSILLEHRGIRAPEDVSINLVAELKGDRVTIVEKPVGRMSASGAGDVAWCGIANLRFFGTGRTAVRFESEVTGAWCTLSLLNVEGFSTSSRMSL